MHTEPGTGKGAPGPDGVHDALARLILAAFVGIAAFFVLAEHRPHLSGWLPHVLPAVCVVLLLASTRLDEQAGGIGRGTERR